MKSAVTAFTILHALEQGIVTEEQLIDRSRNHENKSAARDEVDDLEADEGEDWSET